MNTLSALRLSEVQWSSKIVYFLHNFMNPHLMQSCFSRQLTLDAMEVWQWSIFHSRTSWSSSWWTASCPGCRSGYRLLRPYFCVKKGPQNSLAVVDQLNKTQDLWRRGKTADNPSSNVQRWSYFFGKRFWVLNFEICTPYLFSPSPLWSANFKTKHALNRWHNK